MPCSRHLCHFRPVLFGWNDHTANGEHRLSDESCDVLWAYPLDHFFQLSQAVVDGAGSLIWELGSERVRCGELDKIWW